MIAVVFGLFLAAIGYEVWVGHGLLKEGDRLFAEQDALLRKLAEQHITLERFRKTREERSFNRRFPT